MKKLLLATVFAMLTTTIFAQSPWWVGGHLGVNLNTIKGKINTNDDTKSGYITVPMFGLLTTYSVNDLFSVMGELNYAKTGASTDYNGVNEEGQEFDINFSNKYFSTAKPFTKQNHNISI